MTTTTQQTPREETAERVSETLPGLAAAAAAVGLENHRQMLYSHSRRLEDGHRAAAAAAGFEIDRPADNEEMGDIVITGDINASSTEQAQQVIDALRNGRAEPPAQTASQPAAQTSSLAKRLAAAGLAAMGLGAGAALPIAAWNLTRPQTETPAIVGIDTDTVTEVTPGFGVPEFRQPG